LVKKYQKWLLVALLTGFIAFFELLPVFASTEYSIPVTGDYWAYFDPASQMCSDISGDLYYIDMNRATYPSTSDAGYETSYNPCINPTHLLNLEDLWKINWDNGIVWLNLKNYSHNSLGHAFFRRSSAYHYSSGTIAQPYITITSPANASTITTATPDNILEGNYYNIDRSIYNGFLINFRDNKILTSTDSVDYVFATGDSSTGSFIIPLSNFNFEYNGHFDLHALAYGKSLEIQNGFLTGRGYIDVFSNDLIEPAYNLNINISGLGNLCSLSNFSTWYLSNVSDYSTPDTFTSTMAGYLEPYFNKVCAFGGVITSYINLNEAYDRGFGLGEVFPMVDTYTHKIDMFFGGFPLMSFFKYIIYTLIAIFVIKTILKFIPFIG